MKSLLTLLVAAALSAGATATADAQTSALDRGSLLVAGGASFTSAGLEIDGDEGDERVTNFSLSPSVQYFILPGLAVGGSVQVSRSSSGDVSATNWGIGPAVNYYFGAPEGRTHPYLSAQFTVGRGSTSSEGSGDDRSYTGFRGAAGLLHLLTAGVGVTGEVFYSENSMASGEGTLRQELSQDVFGLAVGLAVFVF